MNSRSRKPATLFNRTTTSPKPRSRRRQKKVNDNLPKEARKVKHTLRYTDKVAPNCMKIPFAQTQRQCLVTAVSTAPAVKRIQIELKNHWPNLSVNLSRKNQFNVESKNLPQNTVDRFNKTRTQGRILSEVEFLLCKSLPKPDGKRGENNC